MRTALALLLVAAPAIADEAPGAGPLGTQPPAPPPASPARAEPPPAPPPPTYGPANDPADGGASYFAPPKGKDIVIESRDDRSTGNIAMLGALGGAAAVMGGIGVYFNLDSKSSADKVSAHKFTGEVWTSELQSEYDHAHSAAVVAGVFYGIGGALLIGTIVAFIATEPKTEQIIIHPHAASKPTAIVAPTNGGALLGGRWRF